MAHLLLWIAGSMLIISNSISIAFMYKQYKARSEIQDMLNECENRSEYLELSLLNLKSDNERLNKINIKLNNSNKDLRSKLDKINNKVKQISEQFKLN